MKSHFTDVINRVLRQSCEEMFAAYGAHDMRVSGSSGTWSLQAAEEKPEVAGIAPFTGSRMRGRIVIASSFKFFVRVRPKDAKSPALSERSSGDWLLVRDWAAELANQLLGRVKNRMSTFAIRLEVGLPTAMSGDSLSVALPRADKKPLVFSNSREQALVWLDATLDEDPDLAVPKEGGGGFAREGDVLLF